MSSRAPLVLVTGASGYIATHVVHQLLKAGHKVRGTVRSLGNEQKIKPLKEIFPEAEHPLELVEADLTEQSSWTDAVKGCTYVLHTASPFPNQNPNDEQDLIRPAVDGTLAVLRACKEERGVKRVVLTSSVAAISGGFDMRPKSSTFSEEDWTDETKTSLAYHKSKTLAEKAAWDFVNNIPEDQRFELAVINPCYVLGPVLCGGYATSMELTKKLLEYKIPAIPHMNVAIVDVRDVAQAHVAAMTTPEAAGKRHILATQNMWFKEIADVYRAEFASLGYSIPGFQAPYVLIWIAAWFDKTISMVLPAWGVETKYDNTRMTQVLGIEPKPVKETLVDMAHSLIKKGFIKMTPKYKDRNN